MPASVGYLVIDTSDPGRLSPFWCRLLDVEIDTMFGDGQFVVLSPTKDGLTIAFQLVPEEKTGKNRLDRVPRRSLARAGKNPRARGLPVAADGGS